MQPKQRDWFAPYRRTHVPVENWATRATRATEPTGSRTSVTPTTEATVARAGTRGATRATSRIATPSVAPVAGHDAQRATYGDRPKRADLHHFSDPVAPVAPVAYDEDQDVRKLPSTSQSYKPSADPSLTELSETEEERAAIIEYDGRAPRAWAEAFARLDRARPRGDVPLRRWMQFVDDAGHFLDQGWASRATALGWMPLDLFGCDRDRPWARIDHAGLIWLLDGQKLVALATDIAVIKTAAGARQTYRRAPSNGDSVVLAWDLRP